MKQFFFYLLSRLKERSTWLGLISLLTACGLALTPAEAEAVIALGMSAAGIVAVFSRDKTS